MPCQRAGTQFRPSPNYIFGHNSRNQVIGFGQVIPPGVHCTRCHFHTFTPVRQSAATRFRSYEPSDVQFQAKPRPFDTILSDLANRLGGLRVRDADVSRLLNELESSAENLNFTLLRAKHSAAVRGECYLDILRFRPSRVLGDILASAGVDMADPSDPTHWKAGLMGDDDSRLIHKELLSLFHEKLGLDEEDLCVYLSELFKSIDPKIHTDNPSKRNPQGKYLIGFEILCDFFFWNCERLLAVGNWHFQQVSKKGAL